MVRHIIGPTGLLIILLTSGAFADGVPDPQNSIVPDCIVVSPGGADEIEITVKDTNNQRCPGIMVEVIFNAACTAMIEFDSTGVFCNQPGTLFATTNDAGRVVFAPEMGGCCSGVNTVRIEADGILLRAYDSVSSPDSPTGVPAHADGELDLADLARMASELDQSSDCVDICGCDGVVDLFDLVRFNQIAVTGSGPGCP